MRVWPIALVLSIASCGLQSVRGETRAQPSSQIAPPLRSGATSSLPVPAHFRSVEDAVSGLARIRDYFIAHQDRRGVFATAYLEATKTFQDWIRRRRFESNERMSKYVVAFANAYRQALADYEQGEAAPEAWRLAFDVSRSGTSTVSEDLLLGINAHINHDLVFAILSAGLDVRSEACHRDHLRANEALREATPRVRQQIVAIYQPPGAWMSRLFASRIDERTASSFVHARNNSWAAATAIATAASPRERNSFRRTVRRCAALAAVSIQANKNSPGRSLAVMTAANDLLSPVRSSSRKQMTVVALRRRTAHIADSPRPKNWSVVRE